MPHPEHPVILLTRPAVSSERLAAELADTGCRIVLSPVIEIVPLEADLPELSGFDVVLTSEAAAKVAVDRWDLSGVRVYTVGQRAADVSRRSGAQVVHVAPDADGLVAHLSQAKHDTPLCHLRGTHAALDLAKAMNGTIQVTSHVIYDQRACPLTQDALTLIESDARVIIPVFSPRSAKLLSAELLGVPHRAQMHLVFISENAEAGWNGPEPASCCRASSPNGAAMVEEIRKLVARLS